MTPEIRQTVLSLRAERQPYKAIVKATGLSSATIYRVLREECMLFAVARADSVEQSFQQFGKSIHDQNQSLAYNLAKAEEELDKRSFNVVPTEKLQRIVTSLRREARVLQQMTDQDLARCHDLFERDQEKREKEQEQYDTPDQDEGFETPATPTAGDESSASSETPNNLEQSETNTTTHSEAAATEMRIETFFSSSAFATGESTPTNKAA